MSSVFGLNARPHTPKVRSDRSSPRRATILCARIFFCVSLTASTASRMRRLALVVGCRADQRLHVFREARTAIAATGIQEVVADARIGADAAAHRFDIRADAVGQIREFVHVRDARGEHGVGRVLGEFGRAHVHVKRAFAIAVERRIEALHQLARIFAGHVFIAAQHDAVGPREVFNGRAFFQELRVRYHGEHRAARYARPVPQRSRRARATAVPTGTVDLSTITLKLSYGGRYCAPPQARIAGRRNRLRRRACPPR